MTTNDAPGPAVSVRVVRPEDAARLCELETRNRQELEIGAPARPEDWFTVDGQSEAIAHALASREAGQSLPLVIEAEVQGSRQVVGRVGLSAIIRGAFCSASLGYWVDASMTGRGIATQAVRLASAAAFQGLGLHRLQAEVQVGNEASIRVLERCGFEEYGLARSYLHLGGRWADCRLLQLLNPAWGEGSRPQPEESAATEQGDEGVPA